MFGSEILEIVIGLALVYLLLSLLASIVNELVMSTFDARGKNLKLAIEAMVDGKDHQTFWLFASLQAMMRRRLQGFVRFFSGNNKGEGKEEEKDEPSEEEAYVFSERVFKHPLFRTLREPGSTRYPSYLSEKVFSRIILDELTRDDESKSEGEDKRFEVIKDKIREMELDKRVQTPAVGILKLMQQEAKGSLDDLQAEIEGWYTEVMHRASGWYKRKTQLTIFVIGLLISITFNADTLKIAQHLKNNPDARAQLVEMATQYAEQADALGGEEVSQDVDELLDQVKGLIDEEIQPVTGVLGLGWEGGFLQSVRTFIRGPVVWDVWGIQLLGWLLTTLALSLGAPFWFDVLNRTMNLRGAAKAVDQKLKDARNKGVV